MGKRIQPIKRKLKEISTKMRIVGFFLRILHFHSKK